MYSWKQYSIEYEVGLLSVALESSGALRTDTQQHNNMTLTSLFCATFFAF